jgi:hypothetical protein
MIISDYDGRAIEILKENLDNHSFVPEPANDDLEFRSYMCVARWLRTTLVHLEKQGSTRSEFDRIIAMNKNEFGTRNWTAYHIRFGEMQSLQASANLILEQVTARWEDKKHDAPPEYNMRDKVCPSELSEYLHQENDEQSFHLTAS